MDRKLTRKELTHLKLGIDLLHKKFGLLATTMADVNQKMAQAVKKLNETQKTK